MKEDTLNIIVSDSRKVILSYNPPTFGKTIILKRSFDKYSGDEGRYTIHDIVPCYFRVGWAEIIEWSALLYNYIYEWVISTCKKCTVNTWNYIAQCHNTQ